LRQTAIRINKTACRSRPPPPLRPLFQFWPGTALIPASAPDYFLEETPTAMLVRQVLAAPRVTMFESVLRNTDFWERCFCTLAAVTAFDPPSRGWWVGAPAAEGTASSSQDGEPCQLRGQPMKQEQYLRPRLRREARRITKPVPTNRSRSSLPASQFNFITLGTRS
jgi:hypothetical protein